MLAYPFTIPYNQACLLSNITAPSVTAQIDSGVLQVSVRARGLVSLQVTSGSCLPDTAIFVPSPSDTCDISARYFWNWETITRAGCIISSATATNSTVAEYFLRMDINMDVTGDFGVVHVKQGGVVLFSVNTTIELATVVALNSTVLATPGV